QIARPHLVDGDQQVGVDRQTQARRGPRIGVGDGGGGVDQAAQAAAVAEFGGQVVVDQPEGGVVGAGAGGAGGALRGGAERDQHRGRHRRGRIGGFGPVRGVRSDRRIEYRQQEAGVVESGGPAEVGGGVDVDQQRVDARLADLQGGSDGRIQRQLGGEGGGVALGELVGDGDELPEDPVPLLAPGQGGA